MPEAAPRADLFIFLLDLGYALFTQNCIIVLEVVGLDLYDGIIHSDKYIHPLWIVGGFFQGKQELAEKDGTILVIRVIVSASQELALSLVYC